MTDKNSGRYQVPSNEDYQPGSNDEVLKNYLGITSKVEIEVLEEQELNRTILELEELITNDFQFSSESLCAFHELWLGDIYPIAGKFRTVDMSKGGILFAASSQINRLMGEFENQFLKKYTPCNSEELNKVIEALAIVHVEFILIHPFREGNGRIGRLFASLMANQARLPPLNFSPIDQTDNIKGYERYIQAIHKGFDRDYSNMENIFREIIDVSQKLI
jgi:cell filamentation protein